MQLWDTTISLLPIFFHQMCQLHACPLYTYGQDQLGLVAYNGKTPYRKPVSQAGLRSQWCTEQFFFWAGNGAEL